MKRIYALAIERNKNWLRRAHPGLNARIGLVQAREHRLGLQGLGNHAAPARGARAFDRAAIGVVKLAQL